MPLDFPDSPSTNDTFSSGGITWKYDGAKWRLVTGSITAASAGTITGTNAEGTSTSFARADHNHAYGALSIPNSALALGPTYETALPSSPVDGQEIYYAADATNGVIWHLRYRSAARSGSGAWEFIGGSSLYSQAFGQASRTSTTAGDLTDGAGPTVTLPSNVTGDFQVALGTGAHFDNAAAFRSSWIALMKVGGSTPTLDAAYIFQNNVNMNGAVHIYREARYTNLSGAYKIVYASGGGAVLFQRRHLSMTPVRVW